MAVAAFFELGAARRLTAAALGRFSLPPRPRRMRMSQERGLRVGGGGWGGGQVRCVEGSDPPPDYAFAKYNKSQQVVRYTEDEYQRHLLHPVRGEVAFPACDWGTS